VKKCSKCGLIKQVKDFYRRRTGPRVDEYYEKCKECMKSRGRSYYHQHREKQLDLAKIRKERYICERKKFLEEVKNKPCLDCGNSYPAWVMDFDHKDGKIKIANVSKLAFRKLVNFKKLKEEIEKCDLVCSNCHRQRTYSRLHKTISAEVANVVKAPL